MLLTSKRTTPPPPNDRSRFPAAQLFLLALVRVAEPIAITSIFPYAWDLVLRFHVGSKQNASFYAGLLVSAFSFTESLTGMYWGSVSDRIGRKPVLLMGCLGTVASLLVVGFSTNFWMALFGRLLGGALNGNIGVIQTMVGELVVNPQHEPKAYAIMPFVWSIGTIIGPSIAGCFASPAETYPDVFSRDGLFGVFPYLLPNLICTAIMLVSIVAGYLCLEETHPGMQPWTDKSRFPPEHPHLPAQASSTTSAADLTHESYGTFNTVCEDTNYGDEPDSSNLDYPGPGSDNGAKPAEKVFTRRVIMLTVALGLFTYHSMTYDHLLPIFFQDQRPATHREATSLITLTSPTNPDPFSGGLGLSVQSVGVIMSLNGLIALAVQALVFPLVVGRLGVWKTFLAVTALHPVAYLLVPFLTLLPPAHLSPAIYACVTLRNLLAILAYPVLLILIKEAAPAPACLGRINGLAASTGAACRTVASPVAGFLYGVGIGCDFTPLAWWASAAVAVVGAVQAFGIHRARDGIRHRVHAALLGEPEGQRKMAPVVRVCAREGDSGYSSEDERTPLITSGRGGGREV